jgi:hypothetical protein
LAFLPFFLKSYQQNLISPKAVHPFLGVDVSSNIHYDNTLKSPLARIDLRKPVRNGGGSHCRRQAAKQFQTTPCGLWGNAP